MKVQEATNFVGTVYRVGESVELGRVKATGHIDTATITEIEVNGTEITYTKVADAGNEVTPEGTVITGSSLTESPAFNALQDLLG